MKRNALNDIVRKYKNDPPRHFGQVHVQLENYRKGKGILELVVCGWPDRKHSFEFSLANVKQYYSWLMNILLDNDAEFIEMPSLFDVNSNHYLTLGYHKLKEEGMFHYACGEHYDWPLDKCGIFYIYDNETKEFTEHTFCETEEIVRYIYTRLSWSKGLRTKSEALKSYFLSKEDIRLEYKGYSTILKPSDKDLRYYGKFYAPTDKSTPIESWAFAGDNVGELTQRFRTMVDEIINLEQWKSKNRKWQDETDVASIIPFFCIDIKLLRQKLENGTFDNNMLKCVPNLEEKIPVTYATKCWDFLLNGHIPECQMFKVEYDEEDMPEERVQRTDKMALEQNNEIKKTLKDELSIDIDSIKIDLFTYFDGEEISYDETDELGDWLLERIAHPSSRCCFDDLISLMRYTYGVIWELRRDGDMMSFVI